MLYQLSYEDPPPQKKKNFFGLKFAIAKIAINTAMVESSFHLYFRSSYHLYSTFLLLVKMNSINWPALNIWVFIAQLVEHCSANAEAMGSNPIEAQKFFSGLNLQLLKLRSKLRWSNLHFKDYKDIEIRTIVHGKNPANLRLFEAFYKSTNQPSTPVRNAANSRTFCFNNYYLGPNGLRDPTGPNDPRDARGPNNHITDNYPRKP